MSNQEAELERVYTVPLSRAWITARHRRTRRAVNMLREFAEKHMKTSEIKITTELNEEIWKRGITKPPRRITVKMEKDEDGVVTISLPKKARRPDIEAPMPKNEPVPLEAPTPTVAAAKPEKPAAPQTDDKTAKKPKKAPPRKKTQKK